MSAEQKRSPSSLSIVNPREFLLQPFEPIRVGELPNSPDVEFLKWLTTLENETGLVYKRNRWFVIQGSRFMVPFRVIPGWSDILIHSHPLHAPIGDLPSGEDFMNASPNAKNFLVSLQGLTRYWKWPVNEYLWINSMSAELERIWDRGMYLKFLEKLEARFIVYPWADLDDEKLEELFYQL